MLATAGSTTQDTAAGQPGSEAEGWIVWPNPPVDVGSGHNRCGAPHPVLHRGVVKGGAGGTSSRLRMWHGRRKLGLFSQVQSRTTHVHELPVQAKAGAGVWPARRDAQFLVPSAFEPVASGGECWMLHAAASAG